MEGFVANISKQDTVTIENLWHLVIEQCTLKINVQAQEQVQYI